MTEEQKELKKLNKINIYSQDREIILDDNSKLYVVFEIEENGEDFLVLTDKEAFIFAKIENDKLVEIKDEAIIEILLDLFDQFLEENELVDENGKSLMEHFFDEPN
ncbi:hypothetical protein [Metamycoplasma alkalescens]|uniref:DUF1292 domain-containing protein n=2 Tax=Metamycoplasma alkalescens TaxID=45363 RepID=N9SQI4_9BACT|nr:hypothetical protein [Metamycoplasma alkalescens]ENY53720.1 Hypothetical protein MALK_5760 [Metamycoplasma alkalescens 14918]PYF42598.1 hypothetical protein BCF88_1084 [Metamycoplasma alkalescens]SYV90325.1 Uncharacterised protein [Metamycoplasma alkalescens]